MKAYLPIIYLVTLCTINLQMFAFAQVSDPIKLNEIKINNKISSETKNEIIEVVKSCFDRYEDIANFWNEDQESFDDVKYAEFMKIFSNEAMHYNDIYLTSKPLPYVHYAAIAYEMLHDKGVHFKIENWQITTIDIDETGFYVAEVEFTKRMFVGMSNRGKAFKIPSGRTIPLVMRIDMPDYLLSDARIITVKAPDKKSLMVAISSLFKGVKTWPIIKFFFPKNDKEDIIYLEDN